MTSAVQIARSPSGLGYRLEAAVVLPQRRKRVFAFFADAFQLERITPPWLHFAVLTAAPINIEEGTIIDYRLRLHGIPIRWQSRIGVWEPPHRFVDEQTHGPYRRWHHTHLFEETQGGTLCRDSVEYDVVGGRLIDKLFVRPDLRKIFAFRNRTLAELFSNDDLECRGILP
jgi:ligand-binding SRPBCC domain-containing protein